MRANMIIISWPGLKRVAPEKRRNVVWTWTVTLALILAWQLPTIAAWIPSARTFVGRRPLDVPTRSGSTLCFVPTKADPVPNSPVFLLAKKKPAVKEEEEEWEEIEYSDEEEYDEEEEVEEEEVEEDEEDVEEEEAELEMEEVEVPLDEADTLVAQTLTNSREKSRTWEEEEEEEDEEMEDEMEEDYWEEGGSLEGTITAAEDWDPEDEGEFPLEDDPDDPNYQKQKELLELAVAESDRLRGDQNFDPMDFMMNRLNPEQMTMLDQLPFFKEVQERARAVELSEEDLEDVDIDNELERTSDLLDDDPYPRHEEGEENYLKRYSGITDDDMEEVDRAWKMMREIQEATPWDKVTVRAAQGFDGLSNETIEEIIAAGEEIGGSAYNVTKMFLYDLSFNVTNLMLAAVKHNRDAPILFQHWYPQLVTYSRYQSAQERDFDFTWEDVENADLSELERYYQGLGYDEIPKKAPAETGIIEFDFLDEEEIKMAAFESWVKDVYNPEWDRKDFDDDDIEDEDNVFSDFYEPPLHPDFPTFEDAQEDIEAWREEIGTDAELKGDEAAKAYRDNLAKELKYTVVKDKEFEEEFRGHLVVACTGDDADLEIAERITLAMEKAFGKQVYVETQVIAHAREEDNVFEVWLESYDIELLHSKRRATSNTKDWTGPAEIDNKQLDYLVDRVGFLISDDSRYSYSFEFDGVV